jgi:hypothetical protein
MSARLEKMSKNKRFSVGFGCFGHRLPARGPGHRDGVLLGRPNKQKIYKKGDGIIQLVASPTNLIEFQMVDDLGSTSRGSGGFGSTSNTTRAMKMQVEEASPKSQILKSLGEAIQSPSPVSDGTFGGMAELYHKSGGIQVRRKYSEEIKQTRSES